MPIPRADLFAENSPAIYGWEHCALGFKVPPGTAGIGGRAQAPFVPGGTFENGGQRTPAINGWAIVKDKPSRGRRSLVRRARAFAFRQGVNVVQAFGHDAAGFAENSPAIYGWVKRHQHKISPVRDGRNFLSSLTGLGTFPNREPSHKWLGYFQRQARSRTTKPRPARQSGSLSGRCKRRAGVWP